MAEVSLHDDHSAPPQSFAAWCRRVFGSDPRLVGGAVLASVLAAGLATVAAWLMIPIGAMLFPESLAPLPSSGPGAWFSDAFGRVLGVLTPARLVLTLIGTYVLKNLAEYAARLASDILALRTERRIRSAAWRAYWRCSPGSFRTTVQAPSDHLLLHDAREAASGVALGPTRLVGDALTVLGYLATMAWISPGLTAVLLLVAPMGAWATRRGMRSITAHADERARSRAGLGARLGELLRFGPVVRAHRAYAWAVNEAEAEEGRAYCAAVAWTRRMRAIPSAAEIMGAGAGALVIWMGLRQIGSGTIAGPEFLTFLTALFLLLPAVKRLAALGGELRTARAAWGRLADIASRTTESAARPVSFPTDRRAPAVRVRNVSVDGAGQVQPLHGVSLGIPSGALVVIVGPTGAGKSVLLEVLAGLIRPRAGSVAWNGRVVLGPDVTPALPPVGYVPQEGWAVAGTVAENLSLGRETPRDAMEAVLREVALALPDGAHTVLGGGGAPLSGGERQRLALARAFLHDLPLLVLDEPTSALDAATERRVIASLLRRKGTATIVAATHRPALVGAADIVVTMRSGRIVSVLEGAREAGDVVVQAAEAVRP